MSKGLAAAGAAFFLVACADPAPAPPATGGSGGGGIVPITTGDGPLAPMIDAGGGGAGGGLFPRDSGSPSSDGASPASRDSGSSSSPDAGSPVAIVPPGSTLFPSSAPWYQDISRAALDAQSTAVIDGLQARGGWGFGSMRIDFSIEVLRADASAPARAFVKTADFYDPDCDFMPVPVPSTGRLEGETGYACTGNGDCHLIVLQGTRLFEMWRAHIAGPAFNGGCLAVWDTTRDYWKPAAPPAFARGDQCSSADAAGYPISALLFSADEVKAGAVNHAIRFILPNDRIRKGEYVHPATHSGAGKGTPTPDTVPYGARFRLKAAFNVAALPTEGARVVARALQRHGMFLADGGNIALTAQADTSSAAKWNGLLGPRDLGAIKVTDFEMVDGGPRVPLTLDCVRARP
jgi:serine/threonine-protein kinase